MSNYPKPDADKRQNIIDMARDVTTNHPDAPIIGYNLLHTIAWLADELEETKRALAVAQADAEYEKHSGLHSGPFGSTLRGE